MAGINDLINVWKNVKEVDLRPYRAAALDPLKLAIVGRPGSGRHTLADRVHQDPQHPQITTQTVLHISDLDGEDWANEADLILLVLDATANDFSVEQALAKKWGKAGKKILALINNKDLAGNQAVDLSSMRWELTQVLRGSVIDPDFMQREFIPAVLELLPERRLALGRQFPLFRQAIALQLINETSFSNAVYSLGTGLAEVVPILDIPLNLTDMIVLTKAQAFLAYKLGLALGFSTRWQDYVAEFGSVLGGGFVWRQAARTLVGLVPVWGIVPKVAVAYAGTYVVGHVILQWYLTGRKITGQQLRTLYQQGLLNGKNLAQGLASRLPHPRRGRGKTPELAAPDLKPCIFCGKLNAPDAVYCQYCGQTISPSATKE